MRRFKGKWLVLVALAVMTVAGCGNKGEAVVPTPTESMTEAPTEVPTPTVEVSYMEKYQDLVVVKPEDTVYNKQAGVEYPEFKKYTYYSSTAERDTSVNVLLPAGYSEEKEYPVLYILHGFWDNEDWMARPVVALNTMLSNLIAAGEAKEMIIVLPYIYCSKDMPYCTGMDLTNSLNYDNFINDLTTDLMPFIESTFAVAKGRENTAITGFSMGARESLFIGFSHSELFGYIGAACPAPGLTQIANSPMHPGQMTGAEMVFPEDSAPYVVMISASKADGVVGSNPKTYHNVMTKNQTEHIWHELSDTGHDHTSVKPHLYNFLRLIFKETAAGEPMETSSAMEEDMDKTYEVVNEKLIITEGEKEIYGKIYRPKEEGTYPAVILSHGYNGCHTDFTGECKYFASKGYIAYAFDFSGGSTRSKSKGASTDMTIFTEKEDLMAVFNYIKNMDIVDKENVFLFGGSQGGLVTALAAEEYVDEIKGMILYFPAFNIPGDWRKNYPTEASIPKTVDFWGLKLGENFFKSMREFYTFENIGAFDKDILIVHGDKDEIVPLSYANRAKKHYKSVELVVLEGEGHGFTPQGNQTAMELALEFMKNHK